MHKASQDVSSVDVSFIIVSWNAKRHLLNCLHSLARTGQGYTSEVIVVDNASSDGSAEAVREQFAQVRLIRNSTNAGFAVANNLGLQHAHGRYWCLVNSDVEVIDGCVPALIREMEKQARIGMLGPLLLEADGKTQISCWGFPSLWNIFCCALLLDKLFPSVSLFNGYELRHFQRNEFREVDILGGAFWFCRREAVQRVGPLDEGFFMYGEDMDWCKRFWEHGWQVWFCPKARAIHYGGASSANAPIRFSLEMLRANLQYWKKHHGIIARGLIHMVYCLHHLIRISGHWGGMILRVGCRKDHRFKLQRSLACLAWLLHLRVPVVPAT